MFLGGGCLFGGGGLTSKVAAGVLLAGGGLTSKVAAGIY